MLPDYLHFPLHFSIILVNALITAGQHGIHDPRTRYRPRPRLRGMRVRFTLLYSYAPCMSCHIYYCTRSHATYLTTRYTSSLNLFSLPSSLLFFTIPPSTSLQISHFSFLSSLLSHHYQCSASLRPPSRMHCQCSVGHFL